MKKGGGAGGHNGLRGHRRPCRQRLSPRAHRHRPSWPQGPGAALVLRDFEPDERDPKTGWLPKLPTRWPRKRRCWSKGGAKGDERYMSRVAHLAPPPKPAAEEKETNGFQFGIVGLPNVGKSTLFNALTATQAAQAANYPFWHHRAQCRPRRRVDPRLDKLAAIAQSAKIVATCSKFVDIAGLVKGRRRARVWGNQFLGNIRARSTPSPMYCAASRTARRHARLGQRRSGARRRDRRETGFDARRPGESRRSACQFGRSAPRAATRRPRPRSRGAEGARRAARRQAGAAKPTSRPRAADLRRSQLITAADDVRTQCRRGVGGRQCA